MDGGKQQTHTPGGGLNWTILESSKVFNFSTLNSTLVLMLHEVEKQLHYQQFLFISISKNVHRRRLKKHHGEAFFLEPRAGGEREIEC